MIRSFACKQTAALWDNQRHKKLPANLQQSALRKLRLIESAIHIDDLQLPPGNRLEQLSGNRKDRESILTMIVMRVSQKDRDVMLMTTMRSIFMLSKCRNRGQQRNQ